MNKTKEELMLDKMISKADLIDGQYYHGVCRNSYIAVWDKRKNCFFYMRSKFGGWLLEKISHPDDEEYWDVFIPLKEIRVEY